ncbi:hypothetical protein [Myxococcus fulvus]|uniref:hypothetical protein n=1 Tax=Myxococcus fulvus TaxID=33 RepID=UPI001160C72B|nr:hypothetical protein [Myxococcus fulvus]
MEASWRWRWLPWVLGPGEWLALQDGGLLAMDESLEGKPVRYATGAAVPEVLEAMSPHRTGAARVVLGDGRVLVTGGMDGDGKALRGGAFLSPGSRHWSPGPSLRLARSDHSMLEVGDGQVLVVGGFSDGRELTDVELVATGSERSTHTGDLLLPLGNPWLWRTQEGLVLALPRGAPTSMPPQRYDFASSAWSRGAALPRDGVVVEPPCGLPRGFLVVLEGRQPGVWCYDAHADTWSEVQVPRHWRVGSAVALREGWVLFVTRNFLDGWLCHPESGTWLPGASSHRPRRARLLALADGRILAAAPDADGCDVRAELFAPEEARDAPPSSPEPSREPEALEDWWRFSHDVSERRPWRAPSHVWGEEDSFRVARLRDAIRASPEGTAWTRTEAEHVLERVVEQWELGIRVERSLGALGLERPEVPLAAWGGVDGVELLPVLLHAPSMQGVRALVAEPTWPQLPEHHPLRTLDDELRDGYLQSPGAAIRTDARERLDWALKGMSSAGVLPSLKYLRVGPRPIPRELHFDAPLETRRSRGQLWLGEARQLSSMAPALRGLHVVANGILAGDWTLPWLEELVLVSGGLSGRTVRGLARSSLPRLKRLRLGLGCAARRHPEDEPIATEEEVLALLESAVLSGLGWLGLTNTPRTDLWVSELMKGDVLARLDFLDLSTGRLSDPGVETLLRASSSFSRLRLVLTATSVSVEGMQALEVAWGRRLLVQPP